MLEAQCAMFLALVRLRAASLPFYGLSLTLALIGILNHAVLVQTQLQEQQGHNIKQHNISYNNVPRSSRIYWIKVMLIADVTIKRRFSDKIEAEKFLKTLVVNDGSHISWPQLGTFECSCCSFEDIMACSIHSQCLVCKFVAFIWVQNFRIKSISIFWWHVCNRQRTPEFNKQNILFHELMIDFSCQSDTKYCKSVYLRL